jgi:RNA polymerase sigma-70 factor (ECF subfamily)
LTFAQQLSGWARGLSDPDAPLLHQARQGNQSAFNSLVRRYETTLHGFLVRRVGPQCADDVLQETFIACWTALPKYEGRARFKAWLFGIAAHKCADHFRSGGHQQQAELPLELADEKNAYHAVDLRELVQDLLVRLPDAQREVIELYYYAELTLPEIAAALNRNLSTVKYQFYRAHAQAADELKSQEI